jgi:hypothetical protein
MICEKKSMAMLTMKKEKRKRAKEREQTNVRSLKPLFVRVLKNNVEKSWDQLGDTVSSVIREGTSVLRVELNGRRTVDACQRSSSGAMKAMVHARARPNKPHER